MAKKQIPTDVLNDAIAGLLHYSHNVKKRNFTETIEIHVGLKNFDPARDRRIQGNTQLVHPPRPKFTCCVFGTQAHIDEAKENKLDFKSLDDLKKIGRDKKVVKKIGMSYDVLFASSKIIRQVPRLLGPTLNRIGKFPTPVRDGEKVMDKIQTMNKTVKFSLKFKANFPMSLSAPVGHVDMKETQVAENVTAAVNFILTLMKKGWQNIKKIHLKSTMGCCGSLLLGCMWAVGSHFGRADSDTAEASALKQPDSVRCRRSSR